MKMRMMKKTLAILLSVAMLICVLAACNKPQDTPQTSNNSLKKATTSAKNNTESSVTERKITSVNITSGNSVIEHYAAAELKWYFAQKNIPSSNDGYTLHIKLDATVAAGGYKITANEKGLAIVGGNERGLAYGLYAFLEKFLGVYIYSADTTVINENDVIIGNGVLDEFEPAFDILRNPWYPLEQLAEKNGGNIRDSRTVKTFNLNALVENGAALPCLSAPENVKKAIKKIQDYLLSGAVVDVIRFLPDAYTNCTCDACTQTVSEEGGVSAIYVRFLNALSEAIPSRCSNVEIELVARDYLEQAPAQARVADGISILISTKNCHISHPVTDETCPESLNFADSVRGWSAICNNVKLEYGLTATVDYIPTFANLGSLRENIRFFAECGVESITCTGNIVCPSGEFGELRVYLISKLLQDPYMSEEEYYVYMDSFLEAYYGSGWEYIRRYIDKTTELAADGHQTANGNPFDAITTEEYLANEADFDEWWSKAQELAGDRADFVKRANYQWRYIKLCLHPDAEEAQKLIADTSDSFNTRVGWREKQWNVDTQKSDLTKSPLEWVYKS